MPLRSRTRTVCPSKRPSSSRPHVGRRRAFGRWIRSTGGGGGEGLRSRRGSSGCLPFQHGSVLAAAGGMGRREAHPGVRRLVRGADLVPEPHGVGQRLLRAGRVALGELHPSAGERGSGRQRLVLEPAGHDCEFVGGRAGAVDVTGGDLDLDLSLEQRSSLQVGVRRSLLRGHAQRALQRVPDRGESGGDIALGETREGEIRLGIPSRPMTGQQRLLGTCDVPFVEADAAQLVQRPAEFAPQIRPQLLARHEGLVLRLGAGPAQPQDLGSVDAAAPVEAADRARPAPPLHRLGPLLRDVVLAEALQGADEFAVDDARRQRIQVTGHGGNTGLVQEGQTVPDVAVQDQQPGFRDPADGSRCRITPRADLDGLPGPVAGGRRVTGQHALVGADDAPPCVRWGVSRGRRAAAPPAPANLAPVP